MIYNCLSNLASKLNKIIKSVDFCEIWTVKIFSARVSCELSDFVGPLVDCKRTIEGFGSVCCKLQQGHVHMVLVRQLSVMRMDLLSPILVFFKEEGLATKSLSLDKVFKGSERTRRKSKHENIDKCATMA